MEEYINKTFCIDNLELLKQLPDDSIDLIYCDVLYNTGNKFKFKDGSVAYEDKLGGDNDVLKFYNPRLIEMKRILKNSGSIFLQCDYRISYLIQFELNKILNFQDKIIWKRTETGKGAKGLNVISKDYDEILHFVKSDIYTKNRFPAPHNSLSLKEYKYFDDEEGKYFKIVPLGMYSKLSVAKMEENNEIYVTKSGKKYKKYYLEDVHNSCMSNIWLNCHNLYNGEHKEMVDYPTQKPKALLERIISMFSNEGDTVVDFFMGSGTTMVVAKELGRNYIGCDINPRAVEITNKRLNEIKERK